MGVYTELVLKLDFRRDIPEDVDRMLAYLFNGYDRPPELALLPHPFFELPRWHMIGNCASFYHVPFALSKYDEGYLFSRSDLKNYSGEIEFFLNWIFPYVDMEFGECAGWVWHEEQICPTLFFVGENSFEFRPIADMNCIMENPKE